MSGHWCRDICDYSHISKSQAREEKEGHAQAVLIGTQQGTEGCEEYHFERCPPGKVPLEELRVA